jgi:transposase, IS5 family
MEEALHDMALFREFAHLDYSTRLPDESTILRFRHRLEEHKLADQILEEVNTLLSRKGLLLKGRCGGRRHACRCAQPGEEQGRPA